MSVLDEIVHLKKSYDIHSIPEGYHSIFGRNVTFCELTFIFLVNYWIIKIPGKQPISPRVIFLE